MLARDRLEEREQGVLPAADGLARPLLSDGAEILEEPALARLDLDRVRVAHLEATDRRLEAPTPDVVRVGVPGDSDRRAHASPGPRTRRFAKKSSGRRSDSLWSLTRVADSRVSTTATWRACFHSYGTRSHR